MSQNELKNLELQISLSQYGLNPKEWTLRPISRFTYLISHKSDPGFKFQGRTLQKNKKPAWQGLQLLSI